MHRLGRLLKHLPRERRLRRRCRQHLRALKVRPPLRVDELCRLLGESRNRPIRLVPHAMPVPGPFGAWIATATADYILYQKETTKAHQDHIVLHEIGHILSGHHQDGDDELWDGDLTGLGPRTIQHALYRSSYDDEQEYEAEMMATIIMEWALVLHRIPASPVEESPTHRIETALGERRGWL